MTMLPSLFFWVRMAPRVKARRSAALVRTRPRHRWPFEEAGKRRGGDLGVDRAVVLVLDPGLRRLVEEGERQIGHMLQHGDETALDRAPERLLLGVLVVMWCTT